MKISELEGSKLDYWTAKAVGYMQISEYYWKDEYGNPICDGVKWSPSTNWQQCGELIEEYHINLQWYYTRNDNDYRYETWAAWSADGASTVEGATPLIAICRCIVASKYGEDVPDEQS